MIERVQLGNSALKVSRLGFGGCPMGGFGWGAIDDKKIEAAIALALDRGVNFFDTADIYGDGRSEILLGQTLKALGQKPVLATKFGVRLDANRKGYYDNSPAWISQALDGSLKRLQTDCIDLFQIHYRDERVPLALVLETLENKRAQGKIRHYGLSNPLPAELNDAALASATGLVSFQSEFSLATRENEALIRKTIEKLNLTFLSWGSLGQGVLSGKYGPDTQFAKDDRRSRPAYVNFQGERFEKNLRIVDVMKTIGARFDKPPASVALRWILDSVAGSVVLVGIKGPDQLRANLEAFGWRLSSADLAELNQVSSPVAKP